MSPGKILVGIDPGKKGGIGSLTYDGGIYSLCRMPDTERGVADEILSLVASAENAGLRIAFILEKAQAMPGQGVTSMFSYGDGYGFLKGVIAGAKCPVHEVRPAAWKKIIMEGVADKSDKSEAIRICENLFPNVELIPGRCKTKQDGMAEALLIAEWGRRKSL